MTTYTLKACDNLIENYVNLGGFVTTIKEGCLGLGKLLLHGVKGKKFIIINEVYLNAWSSGHTIRMYNKLPKKYARLVI